MKKLIIFALLAGLTACTNHQSPSVVNNQSSVASSGDGTFGLVTYGQNPVKSFVFKNNGVSSVNGAPLITGVGFDLALQLGCGTIDPGKSCLVKIMFNSTNKESGDYNATLQVGDALVNLSASLPSVPTPNYVFSVNGELIGTELNLGELSGTNIKLMTIKIKNSSPKSGQMSSIALSNNRFKVVGNTCNNILLKPNQSCIAKVVVQGDNTNNPLSTQISFDGQGGQISATQVEQILSGQMIAVNTSVTLGDFYEEGTNKIQLLKIENQGDGAGNINTSSLTLPPGYTVGSNNCSNVKPGNSCIIRLVYSSSNLSKGSYTDTVTIGDADVDLTVNQVSNPNKLAAVVVAVANDLLINTCAPVQISLKDNENLDYITSQTVSLTANQSLYSDSSCQNLDSGLAPFEPSKTFYLKKSTVGLMNLTVSFSTMSATKNINWYESLQLQSSSSLILVSNQASLTIVGGKAPYNFQVTGAGSITAGIFSSLEAGDNLIKVTDALGLEDSVFIKVVDPLQIIANQSHQIVNTVQTFTATGGLAPFSYSVVSGSGVINNLTGVFTASANAGAVTIQVADSSGQTAQVSVNVVSVLNISPTTFNVIISNTTSFVGSGGLAPYVYSVTGGGTINSVSGLFTAPAVPGTSMVKVTDSLGQIANATVTVVNPLTLSATLNNQVVNTQQNITASGGLAPYVYSVKTGLGTINSSSGLYTAAGTAGSVTFKVTDNSGQSAEVSVNIISVLTISPTSASVIVGNNKTFVGSGGLTPYSYSIVSGTGSVNPTTGVFTADNNPGTTVIKVTDAASQTANATITIGATLVLSAGTCSAAVPESVTCTVSSSGGFGSKTYSVDVGTINTSTGDFKGSCVNNLGSSVVTATDANGNTTSLTLSYPCVYVSCNQIKAESYGLVSAVYWLDLDGLNTGAAPFQAYCDQNQDQGGWALVAKYGNTSNNTYHWFQPATGTLNLNETFDSSMQISAVANSLAARSSEIKINYGSVTNNYYTINQLTTDKNKLWSNTPVNLQLGVIGVRPTSGFAGTNYAPGQPVRMHYGSYSSAKGSGFTSGLTSNQTLDTISDCGTYCGYRLPGIGAIPGSPAPWGLENSNLIAYVKEVYYKYGTSCADAKTRGLKNQAGNTSSGNYWIDIDGANMGMDPYTVYCDMVGNGSTMNATGGEITYSGDYKIHTFKTTGTNNFTITQGSGLVETLVVAGGGSGGSSQNSLGGGGGGGAGGVLTSSSLNLSVAAPSYSVIVGAGGPSGGALCATGNNGNDSSFAGLVAKGGGAGGHGCGGSNGFSGGSGGGGGYNTYSTARPGGTGTSGQGSNGGSTSNSSFAGGAGGGGATGVGQPNQTSHLGGAGGTGFTSAISGTSLVYATGGRGGGGGSGLGDGVAGTANTGNGGNATYGTNSYYGGAGGSGIIIIRYKYKVSN